MPDKQLLICGPLIPAGLVGGLQEALHDLAGALVNRGWRVDLAITPESLGLPCEPRRDQEVEGLGGTRWSRLPRVRFLPRDLRTLLQHILLDGGIAHLQSELFHALEMRLRRVRYDAVIACVSRESPGLARFITARHPHALILSLNGLASELRLARWLAIPRATSRLLSSRGLHPDMYRAVDPERIGAAVFASEAWRDETVRAGLASAAARTIYFAVPHIQALTAHRPVSGKLLWVGRLSREKGLHHFIDAVAVLRQHRPVTLTAICGQGPADYRRQVESQICERGLHDTVVLQPSVPRAHLAASYQQHDVLLFHSVFQEPVALVVLEAFASGLPVVAPRPSGPQALIRPDVTAICYPSPSPPHVAAAIARALDGGSERDRLRTTAYQLVRTEFSLDAMGEAYDAVLARLLERSERSAA